MLLAIFLFFFGGGEGGDIISEVGGNVAIWFLTGFGQDNYKSVTEGLYFKQLGNASI